jgi:hypothetical protein
LAIASLGLYGGPMAFRARVANHRLILDEPTDLPEGSVLDLVLDDEGDDHDDAERERLHAALEESEGQIARGEMVTADELLASLRPKR